jgi:hypothetical protein
MKSGAFRLGIDQIHECPGLLAKSGVINADFGKVVTRVSRRTSSRMDAVFIQENYQQSRSGSTRRRGSRSVDCSRQPAGRNAGAGGRQLLPCGGQPLGGATASPFETGPLIPPDPQPTKCDSLQIRHSLSSAMRSTGAIHLRFSFSARCSILTPDCRLRTSVSLWRVPKP